MRSDGTQTTAVVSPTFQSCRALGMDAFPKLWGLQGLKGALGGSAGGGTAAFPGLVSKTTNYLRTDIQKQLLACSDCLKERKQQQQRQKKGKKNPPCCPTFYSISFMNCKWVNKRQQCAGCHPQCWHRGPQVLTIIFPPAKPYLSTALSHFLVPHLGPNSPESHPSRSPNVTKHCHFLSSIQTFFTRAVRASRAPGNQIKSAHCVSADEEEIK